MGTKAKSSVVDPEFRVWGYDNLYVCDASVFPTSLGVNPQVPIMALADYAAINVDYVFEPAIEDHQQKKHEAKGEQIGDLINLESKYGIGDVFAANGFVDDLFRDLQTDVDNRQGGRRQQDQINLIPVGVL